MHTNTAMLAVVATATAATSIALSAAAHAEASNMYQFLSPSGNIGCHMDTFDGGSAYVWCRTQEETWTESQHANCAVGNVSGAIGVPAPIVQLRQGVAPCTGAVMSQLFFTGEYAPPALGYGQSHTVGTITCTSEVSGVTCTDASTGRFFQVSRDAYQLG